MKQLPINFIEISKKGTSPNELARLINEEKKSSTINVRISQEGDSIGSICLGLLDKKPAHSIWESTILVIYVGADNLIKKQKENNPDGKLSKANLCFSGQYVFLNGNQEVLFVCDDEELIRKLYSNVVSESSNADLNSKMSVK